MKAFLLKEVGNRLLIFRHRLNINNSRKLRGCTCKENHT